MFGRRTRAHPSRDDQLRRLEERLHVYEAIAEVQRDPHRFLDVVVGAADDEAAHAAVRDAYGFDDVQARAALDLQFRSTGSGWRRRVAEDCAELRLRISRLGEG